MIKSDFSQVSDLYLVYPKGFTNGYEELVAFYQKLISTVPNNIRQFIIVNNKSAENEIKTYFPDKNIEVLIVKEFNEIWLRDIMGFNTGTNRVYRPIFKPDYCQYIYTQDYLDLIESQVKEIFSQSTGAEVVELPLILDGGNLVTNGQIGFVTDKVIRQNPAIADYIEKIMFDYLGIKTIILPSNKHDKLAHSDGYMSFLSENKLCVSHYPQIAFLSEDIKYLNTLNRVADTLHIEKITIFDRPVDEKVYGGGQAIDDKLKNCLSSARGCYINFLILNDTIILPEYNIPSYKKTMDYNTINKRVLTDLGYNVITINCDDLAKLGGSLHCISFTN